MQSVLAGQRQGTSTGTNQSWLSLVHIQAFFAKLISKLAWHSMKPGRMLVMGCAFLCRLCFRNCWRSQNTFLQARISVCATTRRLPSSSGPGVGGADTPIDLTLDEPAPLEPSECQHATGPAATAAAAALAYHHAEGNLQRESMPPVGSPSNSGDAMGGEPHPSLLRLSIIPTEIRIERPCSVQVAMQQLPAPSLRFPGGTGCQILCPWLHWQMASTPGGLLAIFLRCNSEVRQSFLGLLFS